MRPLPVAVAAVLGLAALAVPAPAQCLAGVLIPASTPQRHGAAVAADGDWAVCTDTFLDAYFFERTTVGWNETVRFSVGQQTIVPSGAVTLEGAWAAVGVPDAGGVAGEVAVFGNAPGGWTPIATLTASDASAWAEFGWEVDLAGDRLFVSAPHLLIGDGESAVYVFERSGTTWTEVQRLQPSDATPGVGIAFGTALDADGDVLAVGAQSGGIVSNEGTVYVFEHGPGGWSETAKLGVPGGEAGDGLGSAVAVEGDTILAGAPDAGPGRRGAVYVFERRAGAWTFREELETQPLSNQAHQGMPLELRGDRALVGAPGEANEDGRVLFHARIGGDWRLIEAIEPPGAGSGQRFGAGLALLADRALIGAPELDVPGGGRGGLYAFAIAAAEAPLVCDATPSSTGAPARLDHWGCADLGAGRLTLVAAPLPAGAPAVVVFGAPGLPAPLLDGTLCVRAPVVRLASGAADAAGVLVHAVDFATPPGDLLTAGTAWTFQVVFRDPAGGPAGVNLSDAVSLVLEP